jgi:hypothetical protein
MLRRLISAAALAAALLAMTGAPAQAAWHAEDMPGTAGAVPPVRTLAIDREGRALALFEGFLQQRGPQRFTGIATRGPGGGWTSPGDVAGVGWGSAQALTYGRTRAVLVTRQRHRLVSAMGRTDGRFGGFRQIAAAAGAFSAAANPSGDALVAFTSPSGTDLRVSRRHAGGSFGAPRKLSGAAVMPTVAIDPRGDRMVAWFSGRFLRVRIQPAGGSWGRVQTVSRHIGAGTSALRAVMSANGRLVLAWEIADVRADRPVRLDARVAVRARSGGWHVARLQHTTLAGDELAADPAAIPIFDSGGRLLVAYTAKRSSGTAVEVADVTESARVRSTTAPSGAALNATLDDAAAGEGGRVAVTWADHDPSGGVRTFAALRPGTGPFDAPAGLTPPGQPGLTGSRVAFSPVSGEAVVVRSYVADGKGALAAAVSDPSASSTSRRHHSRPRRIPKRARADYLRESRVNPDIATSYHG